MGISLMDRGQEWCDSYPVEERLRVAGDKPLFVDVGGGLGPDLIALKAKFSKFPENLLSTIYLS